MKYLSLLLTTCIVFFLVPKNIYAVSITVNSCPSTISSEIFTVEASISGATNATNFLRIDLFKEGTTNYFGETYNGSDWYNGSDGKNYFPVQIQNSSASASIQAQLGNPSSGSYPGPGMYKLRIRRYTASGSQSNNDVQTPVDIELTYVLPTPTPTETPTPVPTATATPTSTPTPTTTPTSTKTPTPTPTPSPKPTTAPTLFSTSPAVLSTSTDSGTLRATITEDITSPVTRKANIKNPFNYKIPFFAGLALVIGSGTLLYFRHRKD